MTPEFTTNGKLNVVVVDDEVEISELLVEELSSEYSVTAFNSPKAFVEAMNGKKVNPAVLVTDLKMPGLTGLQMLAELKKSGHKVPTVMFSGYLEKDDVIEAVELGVVHILEKPIDIVKVHEAVDATMVDFKLLQKREELRTLVKQLSEMHSTFRMTVMNYIPEDVAKKIILAPSADGLSSTGFEDLLEKLEQKIDGLIKEEDVLSRIKDAQKIK